MSRPNEIVIGLVAAAGCDLDDLESILSKCLSEVGYKAQRIRLTKVLRESGLVPISEEYDDVHLDKQISARMAAGNELRKEQGSSAMARLAVHAIKASRVALNFKSEKPDEDLPELSVLDSKLLGRLSNTPAPSVAWIVRSLKHPKEVELLREVYGEAFFLLAAHASHRARIFALADRIRDSYSRHRTDDAENLSYESLATELVARDEEEAKVDHGQQVRKTFWRGDAYLDLTMLPGGLEPAPTRRESLQRIIDIWFGHPYITPTREEYGMFLARASALRSASMGRQVGAAILTDDGSVIATGTNEIPKFGGGQYWEGDKPDGRDHAIGYDSSDVMKRIAVEDFLIKLTKLGWTAPIVTSNTRLLTTNVLASSEMSGAELNALTEYQRPVHAEMSALMDAARRGVSVAGATLYCTTFPCHGCARHIVAAGITKVVYIEPYAKSLVKRLYDDSIAVEEQSKDRVSFVPYLGVAPRRYMSFFQMPRDRKDDDGNILPWDVMAKFPDVQRDETWSCIERENIVTSGRVQFAQHGSEKAGNTGDTHEGGEPTIDSVDDDRGNGPA